MSMIRAEHGRRSLAVILQIYSCLALFGSSLATAQNPERVLYIRAEFSDSPFAINDNTWLQRIQTIDTVAEDYWTFNSYGDISQFQSSITNPVTIGATSSFQFTNNSGQTQVDVFAIRSAMRNAAANDGWDLNQFDQVVLSFPSIVGFPAGALGTPGTVWIPGSNPNADGLTHEFGHAFGVGHANTFEGGPETYPGVHREGRDGLFMMGSENGVAAVAGRPPRAPINLPMRHVMGFVDSGLIEDVSSDRTVRVSAFDREDISGDAAANRTLGATFQFDDREWWISYAPSLADRWASFNGSGWSDGVVVQELSGAITRSLDFTPASQGGSGNEADYVDTRDGALRVGQSFTFPNSSLNLSPLQTGVTEGVPWIDVRLSFSFSDLEGDFDDSGELDLNDYLLLISNLHTDVSNLTIPQSFARGDITGDLQINYDDIVGFRQVWDQAFGQGALATALSESVPEPSSACLTFLCGLAIATSRILAASRRR